MTSAAARWRTLGSHIDRWLELDAQQRHRWLDELQAQDPALAREVQQVEVLYAQLCEERFLDSGPPLPLAPLLTGTTIGAYSLETRLGYGGTSSVWLARHMAGRFAAPVALKLLNALLVGTDAQARFECEQQVLRRLQHPHIAALLDHGCSDTGQPFLVLEHVHGQPIDAYCDHRSLDVAARVALLLDVLRAVSHVHALNLVHCDLKPANVFVSSAGEVKLLDFGIAQSPDVMPAVPPSRCIPLTCNYASPEQLRGGSIDARSDVYSLGVMLCELLTGARPDPVISSGHSAAELVASLDRRLQAVVLTALAPEPAARYASAAAMAAGLRDHLRGV